MNHKHQLVTHCVLMPYCINYVISYTLLHNLFLLLILLNHNFSLTLLTLQIALKGF